MTISQLHNVIMSGATPIWLSLLSGLLMGINIIVSRKRYQRWHKRIRKLIKDLKAGRGNVRWRLVLWGILLTLLVTLGFIAYGLYQDIPKEKFSAWYLTSSSLLVALGAFVGTATLVATSWGLLKLAGKWCSNDPVVKYSQNIVFFAGFCLAILGVFLLRFTSPLGDSFLVAFSFDAIFLAAVLGLIPLMIRLLALPGYKVVQIGLGLFVISSILALVQYYSQ